MAGGQNPWYHFGVGAPPILVNFSGDWDVHWRYGILTPGHMTVKPLCIPPKIFSLLWLAVLVYSHDLERLLSSISGVLSEV